VFIGSLRIDVPLPRVLERVNLRARLRAILLRKQNVVILARIERRIEVDEIDALILDIALKNVVVVAVIETVF